MDDYQRAFHTYTEDGVIGTFTDEGGEIIAAPAAGIPVSGAISLSQVATHLGMSGISLQDTYAKNLVQKPSTVSLSDFRGASWGISTESVDGGAGMSINKFDFRLDGDKNVNISAKSTSGGAGAGRAYASVANRSNMPNPSSLSGNGYAYLDPGNYSLTYDFDGYNKTNSQHNAVMKQAVFGYRSGYLSGTRTDYVASTSPNATNASTGSRTVTFRVLNGANHVVFNWEWWLPGYSGQVEGIAFGIKNAKVTRTG